MFRIAHGIPLIGLIALSAPATAATIASQNFDDNSFTTSPFDPATLPGNNAQRRNAANNAFGTTTANTVFDGTGLGWTLEATGTANSPHNSGNDEDLYGVFSNTSGVAADQQGIDFGGSFNTGSNVMYFDDIEDDVTLTFDAIDTAGFDSLSLDVDLAVADVNYGNSGFFRVVVNGVIIETLRNNDLETAAFETEEFQTLTFDLSQFDGEVVTMEFVFQSTNAGRDFAFDNVVLSGMPMPTVPLPAGLPLIGVALAGLVAMRRINRNIAA